MNKERLKELYEACSDKYAAAKEFGSTYQSMYNLIYKERTTCKVDLLERIAAYFHVPVSYFFNEEKQNTVASGDGSVAVNGNNNVAGNVTGDNALLQERVMHLEALIEEKNERISELKERIEELKAK